MCDANERPIEGLGLGVGFGVPPGVGLAVGLGLGLGPVKPMKIPVRMFAPAFWIAMVDPAMTVGTGWPSSVRSLSLPSPLPSRNIVPAFAPSTITASCVP